MNIEFVPYKESMDLKDIGFDEPCFAHWNPNSEEISFFHSFNTLTKTNKWFIDFENEFPKIEKTQCTAPLYSQAFRWFRKNRNLEYQISKSPNGNYNVVIHKNTEEYLRRISRLRNPCLCEIVDLYSYEEVELSCLQKLIEIVKNK